MLPKNVAGVGWRDREEAFAAQPDNITSVLLHECLDIVDFQRKLALGPVDPDENVLGRPVARICVREKNRNCMLEPANNWHTTHLMFSLFFPCRLCWLFFSCFDIEINNQARKRRHKELIKHAGKDSPSLREMCNKRLIYENLFSAEPKPPSQLIEFIIFNLLGHLNANSSAFLLLLLFN
jgi:hypothetical protein